MRLKMRTEEQEKNIN